MLAWFGEQMLSQCKLKVLEKKYLCVRHKRVVGNMYCVVMCIPLRDSNSCSQNRVAVWIDLPFLLACARGHRAIYARLTRSKKKRPLSNRTTPI